MKQKLRVIPRPLPCPIYKQSHDTEKVDRPSLTDNQILIEDRIDNYAITNLPNEIMEMRLVDATEFHRNMLYCHRPARDLIIY